VHAHLEGDKEAKGNAKIVRRFVRCK
jgi:hypothetical protein